MTDPSNELQATRIFTEALGLPIEDRSRFLDRACAGNPDLRAEVEALLEAYPQAESLFRNLGAAADAVAGEVAWQEPVATKAVSEQTTEASRTDASTTRIGRYRILEKIGEGGFGEVFIAQQTEPVKRRVALKVLKAGMDTKSVLARFEAERQALALMDHPNIAKVLDAGETAQGRPYFVMDLVEGEPITIYCDRHALPTKKRLELFLPVCRAVQHAHQKGIIHRDIKPSNILVALTDGKPTPKVIDFGIAKATSASLTDKTLHTMQGQLIGTPEYMSPEQAEMGGLDVDTRTDVYSLGVVLYELLAGSLPFDPETLRKAGLAAIQRILREEEPPKPSTKVSTSGERSTEVAKRRQTDVRALSRQLSGELDWITLKAMEKDRTRRYETPNSLAMDIGRYLADEPVLAGPPSAAYRAKKFVKRNRVALGVTAVVLGVVVIGGTAWLVDREGQSRRIKAALGESEAVTGFLAGMLSSAAPSVQGKDVTVLQVLDEAAKTIGENFGEQPLIEARLRHTMGSAYRALGEYENAEREARRAMEIRLRELGKEHIQTLRTISLLGMTLVQRGRFAEAEAVLVPLQDALGRAVGEEDPSTLGMLSFLAVMYMEHGRLAEAESLFVKAVAGQRRVLGDEDGGTLNSREELARLYIRQRRLDEAESIFRETLEIRRRRFGEEDHVTLRIKHYVALMHQWQGRPASAESLLVSTIGPMRRVFGEDHPMTMGSRLVLGSVYRDQGRLDEAESIHRLLLESQRRTLGDDHPNTLIAMDELRATLVKGGKMTEARALAVDLLKFRKQAAEGQDAGPRSKGEYAWMLLTCEASNLQDPEEALRFALAACEQTEFADPQLIDTLALAYHRTGRHAEAMELQRKAIALMTERAPGSRVLAEFQERLAEYEAAAGRAR